MTNIYVSPMASPSFECLSAVAERPPNELSITGQQIKQDVRNRDENENELFESATKASGKIKGHEFETPSGTITTLNVSAGTQDRSSPKRSPIYCFHSFTYGVGGSNENVAGFQNGEKAAVEVNGNAVWEDESFDADSPNVWHTRAVVDPDESGSPTILCEWNMGETAESVSNDSLSSKETSITESSNAFQSENNDNVDVQNLEAVHTNSTEEMNIDQPPILPSAQENENSTEGFCDDLTKALIRRLSPEGAECLAVNAQMSDATGNTTGYLMVPNKRVVSVQRRDFMGSASPSGRMDVKDYWMWDEVVEGREVVDGDYQDRTPLIGPEKSHTRYITEGGLEEVEEGVPVTCFPCRHCVIL
ncbi:hypothetical protein ACROYT_G009065 [Oculina patagonica]